MTDAERDADWIDALGADREIQRRFVDMLAENEQFASACLRFAQLWPIFRASEQRRQHIRVDVPRAEVVRRSLDARIRHRPECFLEHQDGPTVDWPHTLHALYQVRCSLFHGEKGRQSDSERAIVEPAVEVLSHFMSGSGYFD